MSQKKTKGGKVKLLSVILFAAAAVLLVMSIVGYVVRGLDTTVAHLDAMRTRAVVNAASDGIVESKASAASAAKLKELRGRSDFRALGMDDVKALCAEAEQAARNEAQALYGNPQITNEAAIKAGIAELETAGAAYNALNTAERENYSALYTELYESVTDWTEFVGELEDEALVAAIVSKVPAIGKTENAHLGSGFVKVVRKLAEAEAAKDQAEEAAEEEVSEDSGVAVDYSGFVASDALKTAESVSGDAFDALWTELVNVVPALSSLDKKTVNSLETSITNIASSGKADFHDRYELYEAENAVSVVSGKDAMMIRVAANAEIFAVAFIAVLLLAVAYTFWAQLIKRMGVPRTIILLFFLYLLLAARLYGISESMMISNVLSRVGMYGVLALAMLPGIQCGIGLNMGMTLGCIAGLLATVIALQFNMVGGFALAFAIVLGMIIAVPFGWAYSKLLNRMKGDEMTISTYVGYSFVSLMCIGWMLLPFTNRKIIWLLSGRGLRVTHSLLGIFAHLLDDFLSFKVMGVTVPTGTLLFFGMCCLLMWLFSRTKTGIAMTAVGSNPRFAEASGINVDRMRTVGTVLSTVIAAVGIIIYSQAFGYAQLYTAPRQLGFIAASAILIGGATVSKAKVSHVVIGVILFEGVLSLGQQIANAAVAGGGLSEVMRIMISNGIILYALTQSGGDTRG